MCNTYTNGYNDYNVNYRCISVTLLKGVTCFLKKN